MAADIAEGKKTKGQIQLECHASVTHVPRKKGGRNEGVLRQSTGKERTSSCKSLIQRRKRGWGLSASMLLELFSSGVKGKDLKVELTAGRK